MILKTEGLVPNSVYHIYNRANGNEKLFLSQENYRYFLEKYHLYISPLADTYCYCLMANHFHFLIRIKSEVELFNLEPFKKIKDLENVPLNQTLEKIISKQFSNLFSSYTQAFNKQQKRKGSLFIKNFKRIKVSEQKYLLKLVHYIHFNPVAAQICKTPSDYNNSSYKIITSNAETWIKRQEVLDWFDNLENFTNFHLGTFNDFGKSLEILL